MAANLNPQPIEAFDGRAPDIPPRSLPRTTFTVTSMNVNGIATKPDKQRSVRGLMLGIAGCVPSADVVLLQEVKLSERDHITADACQALADNVFPGMTSYWTPFVGAGLRSGLDAASVTASHEGRVMTLRIGDTEIVNV